LEYEGFFSWERGVQPCVPMSRRVRLTKPCCGEEQREIRRSSEGDSEETWIRREMADETEGFESRRNDGRRRTRRMPEAKLRLRCGRDALRSCLKAGWTHAPSLRSGQAPAKLRLRCGRDALRSCALRSCLLFEMKGGEDNSVMAGVFLVEPKDDVGGLSLVELVAFLAEAVGFFGF